MNQQLIRSDICIVGDGAVGKAAALGLAQAGLSVVLLRSGDDQQVRSKATL